jgi:hypothetical protein
MVTLAPPTIGTDRAALERRLSEVHASSRLRSEISGVISDVVGSPDGLPAEARVRLERELAEVISEGDRALREALLPALERCLGSEDPATLDRLAHARLRRDLGRGW